MAGWRVSVTMMDRIYLSPPWQSGDEAAFVTAALRSNWIAPLGPAVDRFETEVAGAASVGFAHAVSSGTAAIHLALIALGVSPGDVVIVPSLTFVGSANPAVYCGAELWFVDSDPDTWTINPSLLQSAFDAAHSDGMRIGALIAVDIFGQCADYGELQALCASYNVPLIEDAAEALGSTYRGEPAGSFGNVGVFSFNGNKIITTSGGGALVSNDQTLIDRCRHLSAQAREPELHYEHQEIGFNYRMSNVLAALGSAQLSTLEHRVAARRSVFARYEDLLGGVDGIAFMKEDSQGISNRWLTTLTIDAGKFGASNLDVVAALEAENIEARPIWKPMHAQRVFRGNRMFGGSVAEHLFEDGLCLPSGTALTGDDLERVAAIVRRTGAG